MSPTTKTELKEIKGNNFYGYKGTFYKYGSKDFLFTLPYERGVSIKVDGKKCDLLQRWNIFSGVDLTSLEDGKHTIEIRYTDTGFIVGKIFSVLALVSLGAILFFSPRFRYAKGENPESVFERRKKVGRRNSMLESTQYPAFGKEGEGKFVSFFSVIGNGLYL